MHKTAPVAKATGAVGFLAHLNHERGGVVAAGPFERRIHEPFRGSLPDRIPGPEEIDQVTVIDPVDEPVRAEQEEVAGFERDGAELGFDELVAAAERFLEHVPARVRAGFAFGDFSLTQQPADVSVVVSELFDAAA